VELRGGPTPETQIEARNGPSERSNEQEDSLIGGVTSFRPPGPDRQEPAVWTSAGLWFTMSTKR
jgi:hypothetical protein